MHANPERHAAILAQIEAGMLALMRDANDPDAGFDGVNVRAEIHAGQPVIDLEYTLRETPVGGESL